MTTYYVTTSGSDSNNGLTEGTAFATPGYAAGQATASGDIIYIKTGTYTLSTTTVNASGGPISIAHDVHVEGYQSTAGDRAARPVINAGTQAASYVVRFASPGYLTNPGNICRSVEVDGNSVATIGFDSQQAYTGLYENCLARNCTTGFQAATNNNQGFFANCTALDCSGNGFSYGVCTMCLADSCNKGFFGSRHYFNCIATGNTSHGFDVAGTFPQQTVRCIAYANGGSGFRQNHEICFYSQCISMSNTQYGWSLGNSNSSPMTFDCADYGNTLGRHISTSTTREVRPINLTADPFTSASTGDFTLNNDAGGGAELRQIQLSGLAGVNGVFDVGAIDAVVTAGGGAVLHPLRSN